MGARAAADSGYQAIALPGYAIGAHRPDDDVISVDAIEESVRTVFNACGLPILRDADVGWGTQYELSSVVCRLMSAGAAAIQLGSQHLPAVVPFDQTAERQNSHDALLSRVDAAAGVGVLIAVRCDIDCEVSEVTALYRANELLAAGADVLILCSAAQSKLQRFAESLPDALLVHASDSELPCLESTVPSRQLGSWGFSGVSNKYHRCYCTRMQPTVARALQVSHTFDVSTSN